VALREEWKTVVLWTVLLCIVGLAHYFATVSQGGSFWATFPWGLIGVFGVFVGFMVWLSRRPLSPEVEAALRRYLEEASVCKRCGAPRKPNDVFCSACHPNWERGIALVLAVGMVWAAFLLARIRHR
jgi:hypothetical protein